MSFEAPNAHFLPAAKTVPPLFPLFPCIFDAFGFHPDIAVANLSRPIRRLSLARHLSAVEGLNNKIRVVTRRSYGFRTYAAMEIALYHTLGRLPEPGEFTHRFC